MVRQVALIYAGTLFLLEPGGKPIRFGRAPINDIVIIDEQQLVSGSHGQVEWRGGMADVVDISRNGIFICFGDEQYFQVDERLVLRGSGRMSLGRPPHDADADFVEIRVEFMPPA